MIIVFAFYIVIFLCKNYFFRFRRIFFKIFIVVICYESLSFLIRSNERSVVYFMVFVNVVLKINAIYITLWVL